MGRTSTQLKMSFIHTMFNGLFVDVQEIIKLGIRSTFTICKKNIYSPDLKRKVNLVALDFLTPHYCIVYTIL